MAEFPYSRRAYWQNLPFDSIADAIDSLEKPPWLLAITPEKLVLFGIVPESVVLAGLSPAGLIAGVRKAGELIGLVACTNTRGIGNADLYLEPARWSIISDAQLATIGATPVHEA